MNYDITYTGLDGSEQHERLAGDRASLSRLVTFLEERGAHCISVECGGITIYEDGCFTN